MARGGGCVMSGRFRFVATLIFAAVLGVALGLFGLAIVIGTITSRASITTGAEVTDIVTALVSFGLAGLCVVWVMHLEHRLRGHPAGKIAWHQEHEAAGGLGPPLGGLGPPAGWRKPRRRRNSPIVAAVIALIFAGFVAGSIVSAVHLHAEADRSSYVQAHGLVRGATVFKVVNIRHQEKSSSYYTARVTAMILVPVGGKFATTIYVPDSVSYAFGQRIDILVDPRQPAYSELPTLRYVTSGQWISSVVVAVIFAAIGSLFALTAIRAFRRRHAWRAMLPGTT